MGRGLSAGDVRAGRSAPVASDKDATTAFAQEYERSAQAKKQKADADAVWQEFKAGNITERTHDVFVKRR